MNSIAAEPLQPPWALPLPLATDDREPWSESAASGRQRLKRAYEEPDLAVLPGMPATREAIATEARRGALIELIEQFHEDGFSWTSGEPVRISAAAQEAASELVRLLPSRLPLPKIAPDGEGGLAMVWEQQGRFLIADVDGAHIHLAKNAGTDRTEYVHEIELIASRLPRELLEAIQNI